MDDLQKKLIIQFCKADSIKLATLNVMQIVLKFQDYLEEKKEEPEGKTVFLWFLNYVLGEITRAANILKSQNLIEAQNLLSNVITEFGVNPQPNFQRIMDDLRVTLTKITSEASYAAKELDF